VQLTEAADLELPQGDMVKFPRSSKQIVTFLSGYANHDYSRHRGDFYDVEDAPSHVVSERPDDYDVYSLVEIHNRPEPTIPGQLARRPVDIYINTAISSSGDPIVNHCWSRFCLVKEACQAIIFEDYLADNRNDYPYSQSFSEVDSLLLKINTEPYSLLDFENTNYDPKNYVENLAEILAVGLLVPFEGMLGLKNELSESYGGDLAQIDVFGVAKSFKVPKRYIELMLSWDGLEGLNAMIADLRS
jgi:hypothetical protein